MQGINYGNSLNYLGRLPKGRCKLWAEVFRKEGKIIWIKVRCLNTKKRRCCCEAANITCAWLKWIAIIARGIIVTRWFLFISSVVAPSATTFSWLFLLQQCQSWFHWKEQHYKSHYWSKYFHPKCKLINFQKFPHYWNLNPFVPDNSYIMV